ncbi:cytochrome P450 [uncultured Tateyamaria sp.]|uniref:cytochrome P450 n=1 Tax=uncultured Tateyamaria sp. TaxID=455651 RepID=UPI00260262CF|nr:cytochrome P450 [uncultured Tateyamaria sp.]
MLTEINPTTVRSNTAFKPPWIKPPTSDLSIRQTIKVAGENRLMLIPEAAYHEPIISGKRLGRPWHMVIYPDGMRHVLSEALDNYDKSAIMLHLLRPTRHGIFHAKGQKWRVQRSAASEVFTPRSLEVATEEIVIAAKGLTQRLLSSGPVTDLYHQMVLTNFEIICRLVASRPDKFDAERFSSAINGYMERAGRFNMLDLLPWPLWLPKPQHLMARRHSLYVRRAVEEELEAVKRGIKPSVFIENISKAVDPETGKTLDPLEIRDTVLAFILAGHETSAIALSWALMLLASDQKIQEEARAEAISVVGSGGSNIGDAPGRLPLCRRILDEAMRLYPPTPLISRVAGKDDELFGRRIRKGDRVFLPICALHRHSLLWEDPHAFRPERFEQRPARFTFLPFGGGPRVCIGASLAYRETDIILAALLSQFKFEMADRLPKPVVMMTLRPKGGVRVKVTPLNEKPTS